MAGSKKVGDSGMGAQVGPLAAAQKSGKDCPVLDEVSAVIRVESRNQS